MTKLPTQMDAGIRYYRAGSGHPRVVLVHGLGTSLDFWNAVAPQLAKSLQVLALDLPGSGNSVFRGSRYDLKSVATEASAFLENEAQGDYVLVGHSLGALVVLQMAALRPCIAKRIILIDPVLFSVEKALTSPRAAIQNPRLLLTTLAQFVGILTPKPLTSFILRSPALRTAALSPYVYAPRNLDMRTFEDAMSGISARNSLRLLNVLLVAKDVDLPCLAKQVKSEVYVIRGSSDPLCPVDDVHRLAETTCLVGHTEIEHCGHLPMLEQPDKLVQLIFRTATDSSSAE